ncbi:hypothetical protein COT63_00595 [Candidatus Shapirobacteria bacterium CG09_land_8_20_14_0_10_38_17]|uniref:Uncharacterized protein n=1 Tax=Candidatus Shapirobacteria bacterium CG09_land_8_20_14_0_10_38_17 TaxID=1974884 RepID=A0A2H0WRR9_9BACT|nr:MAG: hypothetical protein COT63_00595 [Candidatus Shapirobacteria bacterium CG09_land_8_20_14_0_10_38_17]
MYQEREFPYPEKSDGYIFSVSFLAKARMINAQFYLDQELGLSNKEEREMLNLYLAKELLRNKTHFAIFANPKDLYSTEKAELLLSLTEGISRLEEKTEKIEKQVNPERAQIISAAVNDLNTLIKNENPENTNPQFQPTEAILVLWKDKWAPQLASNLPQTLPHHN